jgi:hypothetical protein
MTSYKFVVMTDPVEGREDEYNRWYNEVHLQDVVSVPGFVSAQRFKMIIPVQGSFANRYLSIYELECADPTVVLQDLLKAAESGGMFISEALDTDGANAAIFEICSANVMAPATAA